MPSDSEQLIVREFEQADTTRVVDLWHRAGLVRPWNDPHRDVERRLALPDGLFLVGTVAGVPIASAMGGYEGHRGWVNYVATDPDHRGRGFARRLMQELERRLLARGCPKINLQVREDNRAALAFYACLGYAQDRSISLGKRLIDDAPSPAER